jgi:hypothetical protein
LDADQEGRKEKGGGGLTGDAKSGVGVQKVDVGEVPLVGNGEEDADAMQKKSASSKAWSASPISSGVEVEGRLESTTSSGASELSSTARFRGQKPFGQRSEGAQERGEGGEGRERKRGCSTVLLLTRYDGNLPQTPEWNCSAW